MLLFILRLFFFFFFIIFFVSFFFFFFFNDTATTEIYTLSLTTLFRSIENSVTIDCSIILVEGFKEANYDKIIVYKNNDELRSLQGLSHVIGKIETNHPRASNQLEHLLNKLIKDKGMN